ncbi:DUF5713 family protein [Metabacillus fastidiosus]|uniref:DUF5713 family protein n=1 Tax=Metabacillus fastidiosus TaxID=1458 RepID=A0ABU6NZQ6_9BACI|nr:DUF5713 family protein [Metabacillus fastidiosus]MED4402591.1 DUF5713 family protein [Metabacillus fastidiosus]MED4454766.1 DUF5713 family protein [Metabacillus fastidiosus]MED4461951.1 DUF5713 family protein [Metabacillus fastidiosus]
MMNIEYLNTMYMDSYFPNFLVDKVKAAILKVEDFIKQGNHSLEEIQESLDEMTLTINDIQEEFWEHNSEIETVARDSIGETVETILKFYQVPIDIEEAIRNRDW